jgi:hypothetical protein
MREGWDQNAHEMKQQLDQEAVAKDQKLEGQLLA